MLFQHAFFAYPSVDAGMADISFSFVFYGICLLKLLHSLVDYGIVKMNKNADYISGFVAIINKGGESNGLSNVKDHFQQEGTMLKKVAIKTTAWIIVSVLAVVLSIGAAPLLIKAQFVYQSIWGDNADFKSYKSEFVLVKDYIVENVPQGKSLYFSGVGEHAYDLYDFVAKQYLNCPENIRAALKAISLNASRSPEM